MLGKIRSRVAVIDCAYEDDATPFVRARARNKVMKGNSVILLDYCIARLLHV